MFSYSPSSSGYAVISLDCFDNLSLMVRSRALSKERVFYCIYKIDSFRAIVCKTYLFTGSLSVFELFFLLQRSTWRKHSQTPGRSFLQRQKKTENEWKVKQYATAAHLSIISPLHRLCRVFRLTHWVPHHHIWVFPLFLWVYHTFHYTVRPNESQPVKTDDSFVKYAIITFCISQKFILSSVKNLFLLYH